MRATRNGSFAAALFCASPIAAAEPGLAARLGAEVAALDDTAIPDEVERRTVATVLDVFATLAYTAPRHRGDPYPALVVARGGPSEVRVPGLGVCLPAESAAGVLAYLIHAAETDDSDFRGELRASPVIMGPALAAAGAAGASGRRFLAGSAAGYTVMGRLAAPFGPLQPRGWMSSGIWGPGAGAAAAASISRLDAKQSGHAISLGASAANGPFQYFYDQTDDKRIVVARSAAGAIEGVQLAARGEHGARAIYEGQAGLFALIDPKVPVDTNALTADFARLEGPLYLYPKFFSASSSIIPTLEGIARLEATGVPAREGVTGVTLREGRVRGAVVAVKLKDFVPPKSEIGAKTNFAFMTALYLITGNAGAGAITPQSLSDQRVLALARRVTYEPIDDALKASVVLKYADGSERIVDPVIIDPAQPAPFEPALRERKFRELTAQLGDARRERLRALVLELPRFANMREWLRRVDIELGASTRALPCDRTPRNGKGFPT